MSLIDAHGDSIGTALRRPMAAWSGVVRPGTVIVDPARVMGGPLHLHCERIHEIIQDEDGISAASLPPYCIEHQARGHGRLNVKSHEPRPCLYLLLTPRTSSWCIAPHFARGLGGTCLTFLMCA